ncbi:uncharacterized protein [Paramormyrops kingsleyae]|uniref:uncharacterized protein isoform X2 n=1 Tax=Paramormyrops kingsleyae TaxID=1676925 RepID=UPI003B973AD3
MSTKDPLLSALKVCILSLKSEGGAVTDSNPQLSSCCQLLELVLRKGLQQPVLGFVQRDYWHCVDQLPQLDSCGSRLSLISLALEQTSACKKLLTAQGRGRYFLRLALKRRILGSVVLHLSHTSKLLEWYNPTISIVRNDEFMEPFLSLLLVLSELEFNLNIENCSFLDDSWLLPVCDVYEIVPCRELGMVLRYLGGRVFVLDLIEGSQAQVDGCVLPGDIIDEINGISLRNASNRQAGTVLAQLRGAPLSLRVLRWRAEDGSVYRPVVRLLQELQREHPSLWLRPTSLPPPRQESQCLRDGRIVYIVQYLGKASVGMYGGKEVLQHGIALVLEQNRPKKAALFDLKETHVTCMEKTTKQEIFQYHYPEISCVGRYSQSDHTIFAFCVADCLEPPQSPSFSCLAMRAGSAEECEAIVTRIAIGFKHTEGFV